MKLNMKKIGLRLLSIALLACSSHLAFAQDSDADMATSRMRLMWINHLDLLPGDPSVTTTFNAISSGGLVIHSSSLGDTAPTGGNKTVEMTLQVPPKYLVKKVRICYANSARGTYISQIRLAQLENPPTSWLVRLDDGADRSGTTPICVDSAPTTVDPQAGSIRFSLRVKFANLADTITVLATGLWLQPQ